jgi:hypothetical protein
MMNWILIEWEAKQYSANLQREAQVQRLLREHRAAQVSATQCEDRGISPCARRTGLWTMLRGAIAGLIA